jgi:DNA replication protein DnaC
MLTNATVDGLYKLSLSAMARGLMEQRERPDYQSLSFEDRLGLLVDLELQERENRRLQRSLKAAKLRSSVVIEDIDFRRPRGLDRNQILNLAESHWVANHHSILIVGPTGCAKPTWPVRSPTPPSATATALSISVPPECSTTSPSPVATAG